MGIHNFKYSKEQDNIIQILKSMTIRIRQIFKNMTIKKRQTFKKD
jgi:hypothetical protein